MKKIKPFKGLTKLLLFSLLLSNFSALAQKTKIWIIIHAESGDSSTTNKDPGLIQPGIQRANDLLKTLKREKLQTIYIDDRKASLQTVNPLAYKVKILPRVYTDSVKGLAAKLIKNFEGTNILVVARYNKVIPLIRALGVEAPFDVLVNDDHDLLFAITLHTNSYKTDLSISHYGKDHHTTEIPQQYMLENTYPLFIPPVNSH